LDTVVLAHVSQIEPQTRIGEPLAHLILLELVAAEDADLIERAADQTLDHRRAERSGAAGDEHDAAVDADRRPRTVLCKRHVSAPRSPSLSCGYRQGTAYHTAHMPEHVRQLLPSP